ncbi:MAG: YggS family pyridoxal phosphate-dependent enzyme [Opitutaceae bacterium]
MHFSSEGLTDRLARRLADVRERIGRAAEQAGRDPASIQILPVTKTLPAAAVTAVREVGLPAVGENRVQEAIAKMAEVDPSMRWELIGHLQSNKVRAAVLHFSRIQSVDTRKGIDQIDRQAAEAGRIIPILLQLNAGRDPAKFGAGLEEAPDLLEHAYSCRNLQVDGLMTIAPLSEDRRVARETFARLRVCRDRLESQFGRHLPVLSMGMSGDLEEAVLEGSTLLRLGTILFGPRD